MEWEQRKVVLTRPSPETRCTQKSLDRAVTPEILDYTVDLLQGNSKALKECRIVSKSWILRTRKHIFAEFRLDAEEAGRDGSTSRFRPEDHHSLWRWIPTGCSNTEQSPGIRPPA